MKPTLTKRIFFAIISLLPVALAHAGLPGPAPPPPPPVPTPPPDADFDYVKVDDARGQSGVDTQLEFGTTGKDKIIEYGGLDSVTQYISGDSGNDWLLQVGGSQASTMTIDGGLWDDIIYQYGGQGNSDMSVSGGAANDTLIQVGGRGDNIMTYKVSAGNDVVTFLGGRGGSNTLTVVGGSQNFTVKDYQGNTLCKSGDGGSTITIANLNRVTVYGRDRKIIWQYSSGSGTVPTASAQPLLLGD